MLIIPLKTSKKYNIHDALAQWLDNYHANNNNSRNNSNNPTRYSSKATTSNNHDELPSIALLSMNLSSSNICNRNITSQGCYKELQRLQSVRNCIVENITKYNVHSTAIRDNTLRDLYEYHAILLQFEYHGFPTIESTDDGSNNNNDTTTSSSSLLSLSWYGAHNINDIETHYNTLVWDRVCVLYNIVALLSYKIVNDYSNIRAISTTCSSIESNYNNNNNSTTIERDVYKAAIRDCQLGASIVSIIREVCSSITDFPYYTVDLSSSLLLFYEKLFLAEAQGYIYRMACINTNSIVLDKDTTLSKDDKDTIGRYHRTNAVLCLSLYELYNDTIQLLKDPRLVSEIYDHIQIIYGYYCMVSSYYAICRCTYHQSILYRVQDEYGNEIVTLRETIQQLEQCINYIQNQKSTTTNDPISSSPKNVKKGSKDKKEKNTTPAINPNIINTFDTSVILRECTNLLSIVKDRYIYIDQLNLKLYHDPIPKSMPKNNSNTIKAQQLAKINPILPNDMIVPTIPLFIDL